jgi:hypothetical protein
MESILLEGAIIHQSQHRLEVSMEYRKIFCFIATLQLIGFEKRQFIIHNYQTGQNRQRLLPNL